MQPPAIKKNFLAVGWPAAKSAEKRPHSHQPPPQATTRRARVVRRVGAESRHGRRQKKVESGVYKT